MNQTSYRYEFTANHDMIQAINLDSNTIDAMFSLNTGYFFGKRQKVMEKNIPGAFHERTVATNIGTYCTREEYFIKHILQYAVTFRNIPEDFNVLIHRLLTSQRYVNRTIADHIIGLSSCISARGCCCLSDEQARYISDIFALNINMQKIVTYLPLFLDDMDEYNNWLCEYPQLAYMYFNNYENCVDKCNEHYYSHKWLLHMLKVIANDGLVVPAKISQMMNREAYDTFVFDNVKKLINNYYKNIVKLGELDVEPIEEGFLNDYARTCALVMATQETKSENKMNGLLRIRPVTHTPVTFGKHTFIQITNAEELANWPGRPNNIQAIIGALQNVEGYIVRHEIDGFPSDTPFMVTIDKTQKQVKFYDTRCLPYYAIFDQIASDVLAQYRNYVTSLI